MVNLQKELDNILASIDGSATLLLHSCCAPCSSYVLEYLLGYFGRIHLLFYNPNIIPEQEFSARLAEQRRIVEALDKAGRVEIHTPEYDPAEFLSAVKGYEAEPEGGARCDICFELRLREGANWARRLGADYFTTTLSISPHKDSAKLDSIARKLEGEYGVKRLPADFKKKGGYQRSVQLSKEYNLYRQDWCGCPFSKAEGLRRKTDNNSEAGDGCG